MEPISAVIGAWAVTAIRPILPYALAFAAGVTADFGTTISGLSVAVDDHFAVIRDGSL